eukprot:7494672-Pyramimonas_sp.AAC.1
MAKLSGCDRTEPECHGGRRSTSRLNKVGRQHSPCADGTHSTGLMGSENDRRIADCRGQLRLLGSSRWGVLTLGFIFFCWHAGMLARGGEEGRPSRGLSARRCPLLLMKNTLIGLRVFV